MFSNKRLQAERDGAVRLFNQSARLVDIQRNGRMNVFTFIREGKTFTIETMGLLSDDLPEWRRKAGL